MRLMTLRTAGGQAQVSGYSGGNRSSFGIGGAIAVHALVVGAYLLMPKEVVDVFRDPPPLLTYPVDDTPPPPEQQQPENDSKPQPRTKSHPTVVDKPVVPPPPTGFTTKADDGMAAGDSGMGTIMPPIVPPTPEPVLADATIDPRALAAFQPDYPGAMIRQGMEGKVVVRVTIGPDGRVTDIERLSAADEAFWIATQRHALRKWRFRPATRDGVPVSSTKVLTVHFRLADV
ncbi:energy transducer TonB [Sphingobium fuliginis]|uniref:Protein TonB n=1 Tax=Sphingobium fuliginis (strain ATCC 27551) TaxID=336203 RepID=A0A292ZKS9_SPHSA|nr:energy transducer TonB [Sphingobium fuliginis]GAY23469.1 ferric siderophore transport system, periplasmic binding protein TonB [Sphingobium fuliginis]